MMPIARWALVAALTIYVAGSSDGGAPLIVGVPAAAQSALHSDLLDSGLGRVDAPPALSAAGQSVASAAVLASTDYGPAMWVPAAATNYSIFNRPDDYPVDMVIIHDIEGSATSAIKTFQDPARHGSAHYIVSYKGKVWQMVLEKDVAWHAGNWDYNTRSIGIEHEGFAWTPGLYTPTEYRASAHIAASICSRWGVPMDRSHVIGHNQVPDPYHPGLYGGDSHHTDPGPYWNWTYYIGYARYYASLLPSPPHMQRAPVAVPDDQSATVTWVPAPTCHTPITSYHVVLQPGNIAQDLPGTATTATFGGLQNGTTYSFIVTAINPDGQSGLQSNSVIAGPHCATASLVSSLASPQLLGTALQLTASSTVCPNPHYRFLLKKPNGKWSVGRAFRGSTWTWETALYPAGAYTIRVWANQTGDNGAPEAYADIPFSLIEPPPCTSASISPTNVVQPAGSSISFIAGSTGCTTPLYAYWVRYPNLVWHARRSFSTDPTWTWSTAGLAPGKYTVRVWVNHPGHSTTFPEVFASSAVTLTGCTSATLAPASGSSTVGTQVLFTAGSSGCPNPVYKFWLKDTLGKWHVMRDFSTSATWTWDTGGWAKGVYQIVVWASQQGAYTGAVEAYKSTTHTLT
jgi:hypothetical protein